VNPPARTKIPGSLTEMWPACSTEALRAAAAAAASAAAASAAAASSLHLLATSDGSIDLGVDRSTKLF
jgi:hypothetical protein